MKTTLKVLFLVAVIGGIGYWLWSTDKPVTTTYYGSPHPVSQTPVKLDNNPLPPINAGSLSKCHADKEQALPDPNCTPGATNPQITQANIKQNICNPNWTTKSIRPPVSYTNKLKAQDIKDYGYSDTSMGDYELDHLISLEIGGNPTDPKNLWPEAYNIPDGAKTKDKVENYLHKQVCSGAMTLSQAQKGISTDWTQYLKFVE